MDKTIIIAAVNVALENLRNEQLADEGQTFINQEVIDLINLYLEDVLEMGQANILREFRKIIIKN